VYSSLTGTFGGTVRNSAGNRFYPYSYTVSTANTWTSISVTIAGDTSGTWATDNTSGIELMFSLGSGSTVSGTAGAWGSTVYYSVTGATSVVGTNGATFYITGVQLEVGSSATGFMYVNYQTSLANCQRYYQKAQYARFVGGAGSTTSVTFPINLVSTMRATPTFTGSVNSITRYDASGASIASATYSINALYDNNVGLTVGGLTVTDNAVYWTTLNASSFSAEL
jgi:hypothetical protein